MELRERVFRHFDFQYRKNLQVSSVLSLRAPTQQKCGAVPRMAHIQGLYIVVPLNSRLEGNAEEAEQAFPSCPATREIQPRVG